MLLFSQVHSVDWNNVVLSVSREEKVTAYLNDKLILEHSIKESDGVPHNGWVGLGTANFGTVQFDNFAVKST